MIYFKHGATSILDGLAILYVLFISDYHWLDFSCYNSCSTCEYSTKMCLTSEYSYLVILWSHVWDVDWGEPTPHRGQSQNLKSQHFSLRSTWKHNCIHSKYCQKHFSFSGNGSRYCMMRKQLPVIIHSLQLPRMKRTAIKLIRFICLLCKCLLSHIEL